MLTVIIIAGIIGGVTGGISYAIAQKNSMRNAWSQYQSEQLMQYTKQDL